MMAILGWIIWGAVSALWLATILRTCRFFIALEYADYRRRLANSITITSSNAWPLLFGAEVIKPPNVKPIAATFGIVFMIGEGMLSSWFIQVWG